jgi:hypothetical protein
MNLSVKFNSEGDIVKQRITIEQLQELTSAQERRLRTWWERQDGDRRYGCRPDPFERITEPDDRGYSLPVLNMGQMIEIIGLGRLEKVVHLTIFWNIPELCDALWDEVKKKLDDEEYYPQSK